MGKKTPTIKNRYEVLPNNLGTKTELNKKMNKNKRRFSWEYFFGEAISQFISELIVWILFAALTTFPLVLAWLLVSSGMFWLLVPFVVLFGVLIKIFYKKTFGKKKL